MKTEQTEIPVNIQTDYTHESGNELENARQQIELSSFYLQSLFNSIKYLASDLESRVEEKEQEYCYDLRNLSEIGYAVCGSIFRAVSVFEDIENDIRESEKVDETAKPMFKQTDLLTVRLSEILNDSELPVSIYNAFMSALDDVRNELSSADAQELEKYETSPEYLKAVFVMCGKSKNKGGE
jgi:hypothetical protein